MTRTLLALLLMLGFSLRCGGPMTPTRSPSTRPVVRTAAPRAFAPKPQRKPPLALQRLLKAKRTVYLSLKDGATARCFAFRVEAGRGALGVLSHFGGVYPSGGIWRGGVQLDLRYAANGRRFSLLAAAADKLGPPWSDCGKRQRPRAVVVRAWGRVKPDCAVDLRVIGKRGAERIELAGGAAIYLTKRTCELSVQKRQRTLSLGHCERVIKRARALAQAWPKAVTPIAADRPAGRRLSRLVGKSATFHWLDAGALCERWTFRRDPKTGLRGRLERVLPRRHGKAPIPSASYRFELFLQGTQLSLLRSKAPAGSVEPPKPWCYQVKRFTKRYLALDDDTRWYFGRRACRQAERVARRAYLRGDCAFDRRLPFETSLKLRLRKRRAWLALAAKLKRLRLLRGKKQRCTKDGKLVLFLKLPGLLRLFGRRHLYYRCLRVPYSSRRPGFKSAYSIALRPAGFVPRALSGLVESATIDDDPLGQGADTVDCRKVFGF